MANRVPCRPRPHRDQGIHHQRPVAVEALELGGEDLGDAGGDEVVAVLELAVDGRRTRSVHHRGPQRRGQGFVHPAALLAEHDQALGQIQIGIDRMDHRRHLLGDPVADRGVERLEVVEVLEHRTDRHRGPFGDPGGGGTQVTLGQQGEGSVHDRLAGPHRPGGTPVNRLGGRDVKVDCGRHVLSRAVD